MMGGMHMYRELANDFINIRREYPHVKFEKEIFTKLKNDIFILSYLQSHGGAAHPKELSEDFMISSARMAVILKQLEAKGSIARTNDPQDSRQTIIQITAAGREFFEACNARIVDFIARIFEKIGEKDARELIRINQEMMRVIAEGR